MGTRMVICTENPKRAKTLAKKAVENRMAACVQVIDNITSYYWWEEKLTEDNEALLFFKTTEDKVKELIQFIKQNHSYQVPEILSIEINESESNPDYLSWLREELSK